MLIGKVREVWRYPVKSMGGEQLPHAALGTRGIPGDRGWALRDEQAGEIRGARNFPALLLCRAQYLEEPSDGGSPPAAITMPDGTVLRSDSAEISARLSQLIGRPVTLCPLRPADDLAHYRRGRPDDPDLFKEIRRLLGRLDNEPLPNFAKFPRELMEFVSPPGTYFDAFPLHLVTTTALAALRRLSPGSDAAVRRFRPNLLIEPDGDTADFADFDWCGGKLRVGKAEIAVHLPAFRCAMPIQPQPDLPKDPALLRAIVRHADQNLGVYASVLIPGAVAAGDTVEWVARPPVHAPIPTQTAAAVATKGAAMADRRLLVPAGTEIMRDQFHFSQGVQVGNTIYVSGQAGFNESFSISDDVGEQARQAFRNMARVLAEAGASLDDVVEITSYHLDMSQMTPVVNALREAFPNHQPAWTAVGVTGLAMPQMRVEIKAVAVRGA